MNQKLELLKTKSQTKAPEKPRRKKQIQIAEKGILLAIPLGFLAILTILHGDKLLPAKKITVAKVLAKEIEQTAVNSQPPDRAFDLSKAHTLFQASGWLEADPYPYRATALVNGVIDKVLVLEGAKVKEGDLIATLINDDAKLDWQSASIESKQAEAEYEAQKQKVKMVEAELLTLEKQIETAKARLAELTDNAERKKKLADGAIAEEQIIQAVLREETQKKTVLSLESTRAQLVAKSEMERHKTTAAKNRFDAARTDLARKKLALERTEIRSPISGIVQSLKAEPGQKKVIGSDHPESITVAVIFDPKQLQARIDVPLEEASKVFIGQTAKIRTAMLPDHTFHGKITRMVGESDIQRNTLQVKVSIEDPDPRLRPEMLCRAEFLEDQSTSTGHTSTDSISLFIPQHAIASQSGSKGSVFKLNESRQRIIKQTVEISSEHKNGYYQIIDGLKPGDQVVLNPTNDLRDNQRINVIKNEH